MGEAAAVADEHSGHFPNEVSLCTNSGFSPLPGLHQASHRNFQHQPSLEFQRAKADVVKPLPCDEEQRLHQTPSPEMECRFAGILASIL